MRMSYFDFFLFFTYALFSVSALLFLKIWINPAIQALNDRHFMDRSVLFVAFASACYATSFLLWIYILSRHELSVAFPLAVGLTLVASVLLAHFALSEDLGLIKLIGIAFVFAGSYLLVR